LNVRGSYAGSYPPVEVVPNRLSMALLATPTDGVMWWQYASPVIFDPGA